MHKILAAVLRLYLSAKCMEIDEAPIESFSKSGR